MCVFDEFTVSQYLLNRDSLKASAVLITSTYACNSNRLAVTFKLWFSMANLNADCTSSVPCSNIAPASRKKNKTLNEWQRKWEIKKRIKRWECRAVVGWLVGLSLGWLFDKKGITKSVNNSWINNLRELRIKTDKCWKLVRHNNDVIVLNILH